MAKVEIKPLPLKKWHGKKDKESFAQTKTIEALYSNKLGGYQTGLTDEEAEVYGKKLGFNLNNLFDPEKEHPFWSQKIAQVRLENATTYLDPTKPLDYVKIKLVKVSKYVANSMREWEEGKWPDATHVIYDENEEADVKASTIQKRNKAIALASKMTLDEKATMVLIVNGKYVKNKSLNFIDVEIDEAIEEKVDEFIRYASMDVADMQVRGSILEGLHRQILTQEGAAIYYMGERIGFDIEDAMAWFQSPDNQKLKVAILERLNGGK
jgi:hypothetical protein